MRVRDRKKRFQFVDPIEFKRSANAVEIRSIQILSARVMVLHITIVLLTGHGNATVDTVGQRAARACLNAYLVEFPISDLDVALILRGRFVRNETEEASGRISSKQRALWTA